MRFDAETGQPIVRQVAQVREVYFIHAQRLDLIKIGVADNARIRLRALSNACPDQLTVLGVLICRNQGRTEEEIHAQFADARYRGEWFLPTDRLRDYITAFAWNPVRVKALQAYLDLPTMRRGRPKQNVA